MSEYDSFAERSIIVMKGHPFTRKTEFAGIIARSLGCPILSSEDFFRCLTPPLSSKKEDEAFKVICQIAFHHLDSGMSKNVVIDSSLSSESHLYHLTHYLPRKVRVIVIECKPSHTYSWKFKFEQDLARRSPYDHVKWYKPMDWESVENAIDEYPDYDVTSMSSGLNFVSQLVVDPLLDFPLQHSNDMYSSSRAYSDSSCGQSAPSLVEAVKYMMTRDEGDGPDVVVYKQWLQQSRKLSSSSGEEHCSRHGHNIVPNSTAVEEIQHETVDCKVCERQVTRSNDIDDAYCYCTNCSLTLHMKCALTCRNNYDAGRKLVDVSNWKSYACKPCKEGATDKYIECKACQFNYYLKTHGYTPIATKHFDTKAHFLTVLFRNSMEVYRCVACGDNSEREEIYLCNDCGSTYHYECVTMPRRVKNVHGAHHHHMTLKFESEEAEDYLCQECQELRDPTLWYYACEDCSGYELHPSCVAKLRAWKEIDFFEVKREWMDKEEIEATKEFRFEVTKMKEYESISDFYSRVIYLIQWYGHLKEDAKLVPQILGSLPLKFYHIVVAIKRSKEYKTMTVDQLMICLRVYEKRIDNGEDVLIEQVLANLYATQRRSNNHNYYKDNWVYYYKKSIMKVKDVSLKSVLRTDYSKQESGDNWVKHWKKYWDNYWFNYQRGYCSSQEKCEVQCSICKMFGHDCRHCWIVPNKAKKKPLKIKFLIQSNSSQRTFSPRSEIEGIVLKN